MTRPQKLLPILLVIIITLTACPPPEDGVSVINIKQANEYIQRFQESGVQSFATEYRIDMDAIEAMGGGDISIKVFHAIDEDGSNILVLAPATPDGSILQEGPFMKQRGVCPPMCDIALTPAETVRREEAVRYIAVYDEARRDDEISSFQVTSSVLEEMRNEGARGLKIHHGLAGDDHLEDRVLVVMGLGDDRTAALTNLIYRIDKNRLCPQMCDVIGTTQTR